MSQIAMTIIDSHRAIHGRPHGSFVDAVVASLGAEPETIEELQAALTRCIKPVGPRPLAHWALGTDNEPFDAGICMVDLTARLVVLRSTYSAPGLKGEITYRDDEDESGTEEWLSYHLSDDWMFSDNVKAWAGLAEDRRQKRLAAPPLDARRVLYGKVCQFIAEECFAARGEVSAASEWTPPEGWSLEALPQRAEQDEKPTDHDAVAEIHARWLITPREDLRGLSPRDVLLAKKDHIDWDLQDRASQWSRLGECPPGLSSTSAAFRFAGFGTHENVLYYELVRHLVCDAWQRIVHPEFGDRPSSPVRADEVARLEESKEKWMNEPQAEGLGGWMPTLAIERERMRLPMAVSGKDAMIDDDCPLCQMMAEDMGPMFWHLDGCNMDDDFPFSFHTTREEWEEERRSWEELDRKFEAERKSEQAGAAGEVLPWDDADADDASAVWQRSLSSDDNVNEPPHIALFGIGAHVAELGVDLKASAFAAPLVQTLNRHFGNLRDALTDPSSSLVEPVVERFCEELDSVTEALPELAAKCADLQRQLNDFAARLSCEGSGSDDIPF